MENALKGLLMASGIILTCMIIGTGFYVAREAKAAAFASAGEITRYKTKIEESYITKYDGMLLSGNETVNLINDIFSRFAVNDNNNISVRIIDAAETVYTDNTELYLLRDMQSSRYITPTAEFQVRVKRDKNGVISEVLFTRK